MAKKILIVDDEANMLRMLGMTLEAAGYTVAVAQEAETARARSVRRNQTCSCWTS